MPGSQRVQHHLSPRGGVAVPNMSPVSGCLSGGTQLGGIGAGRSHLRAVACRAQHNAPQAQRPSLESCFLCGWRPGRCRRGGLGFREESDLSRGCQSLANSEHVYRNSLTPSPFLVPSPPLLLLAWLWKEYMASLALEQQKQMEAEMEELALRL